MAKDDKRRIETGSIVDEIMRLYPSHELLSAIFAFGQAWNIWARILEKAMRQMGLTTSQLITIIGLFSAGKPMSPTEISRLLPLETHSVSSLLDRLHKLKLITRRRSRNDRRVVVIELTDQGNEILRNMYPRLGNLLIRVFGGLSRKELQQLERLSLKIAVTGAQELGGNPTHMKENLELLASVDRKLDGSVSRKAGS